MSELEVEIRKGEPVEKALKRLKKKLDRENVIQDVRQKRYHEKPSMKKRLRNKRLAFTNMLRERYKDM
ncbi:MAG: 30S ribosomal protein S21 [Verrucomicrobia bacterium CG_4_10_14_3_um_filter_43_23]|nr:MAG: 30S ribosomal protein S21 [Verrucomicrobia bacterium CG1_02_43_26]PIP59907.1 MAG: 30S ribosomal protein S21 [Verrucomicrobia bacterium CG22_combo_CG10-13_8_21_14_all_43_17]PIX58247.1 MAG: 30S ribosomal protein S21 [Verrucomicrobia bacterium CG_4_10_14_3_um_filter_43_23]PIY62433.1 MAG: 30S ribosomal protein S21 [Verrucomicrobia bacterium CG_4_10_14_0_8_um_filter_43_34]PJA44439.1 MAG: 30S ribosomal protein S21 [Verrucomicrobia bacterium CG_4_9_14_3_um_filter_43_20]